MKEQKREIVNKIIEAFKNVLNGYAYNIVEETLEDIHTLYKACVFVKWLIREPLDSTDNFGDLYQDWQMSKEKDAFENHFKNSRITIGEIIDPRIASLIWEFRIPIVSDDNYILEFDVYYNDEDNIIYISNETLRDSSDKNSFIRHSIMGSVIDLNQEDVNILDKLNMIISCCKAIISYMGNNKNNIDEKFSLILSSIIVDIENDDSVFINPPKESKNNKQRLPFKKISSSSFSNGDVEVYATTPEGMAKFMQSFVKGGNISTLNTKDYATPPMSGVSFTKMDLKVMICIFADLSVEEYLKKLSNTEGCINTKFANICYKLNEIGSKFQRRGTTELSKYIKEYVDAGDFVNPSSKVAEVLYGADIISGIGMYFKYHSDMQNTDIIKKDMHVKISDILTEDEVTFLDNLIHMVREKSVDLDTSVEDVMDYVYIDFENDMTISTDTSYDVDFIENGEIFIDALSSGIIQDVLSKKIDIYKASCAINEYMKHSQYVRVRSQIEDTLTSKFVGNKDLIVSIISWKCLANFHICYNDGNYEVFAYDKTFMDDKLNEYAEKHDGRCAIFVASSKGYYFIEHFMSDKDFKESNVIGLDSTDSMLKEVALAFVVAARKIKAINNKNEKKSTTEKISRLIDKENKSGARLYRLTDPTFEDMINLFESKELYKYPSKDEIDILISYMDNNIGNFDIDDTYTEEEIEDIDYEDISFIFTDLNGKSSIILKDDSEDIIVYDENYDYTWLQRVTLEFHHDTDENKDFKVEIMKNDYVKSSKFNKDFVSLLKYCSYLKG